MNSGIGPVAVEEVFGVEEDPEIVGPQELHRVGHHGDGLVERGAQGVHHVHLRRLGHDADGLGLGLHQVAERLVVLGPHAGPPGGAEGHQRGPLEVQLLRGPGEELGVLRVGPRPSALDEGHPEVVELLGHPELVVHGQRQALLLGPVPQGGVEHVHRVGQGGQVEVVAGPGPPARGRWSWSADSAAASVGLLARRQRVGVGRSSAVAVGMAVAGWPGRRPAPADWLGLVVEGGAVTRHSPTSPCTAPPRRARRRSTSAGSAG